LFYGFLQCFSSCVTFIWQPLEPLHRSRIKPCRYNIRATPTQFVVYIAASADGFIARPDGSVDWLNRPRPSGNYGTDAFYRSIDADTIHLVLDNLSSHTRNAVVERFGEKAGSWLWDRFAVHYTPKHGSWLNQAEIAISLFSRQCLGQRRIGDRASLRRQTQAWSRRMNRHRAPIQWKFTRKKARRTFDCTITRSRH
jgi:hypothetical protein